MYTNKQYTYVHQETIYKCTPTNNIHMYTNKQYTYVHQQTIYKCTPINNIQMYTKKQYTYVHQQTIYKCTPTIKDKCTTTNKKNIHKQTIDKRTLR